MKRVIRAALNNIEPSVNFKHRVIDLVSMLPQEQHENALAILLGATEDIYLGEVKCESGKQPTDTNYKTIDFNHLTQEYTVQYQVRKEVLICHDFTSEELEAFKLKALELSENEIKNLLPEKGSNHSWAKTNEWETKTKLVPKYQWEKHYKEII